MTPSKILNLDMQVAADTYLQSRINDVEHERDRFAALFENIPTPVVVVELADNKMYVREVNSAFRQLFGYNAEELADHDFEAFLTPPGENPEPIKHRSIIENIQNSSESELSEAEVVLETQFGRREFIRVSAPVDKPTSKNIEYAFYIDVTDEKQRQERLQVLARILRHDLRNKLNIVKGSASELSQQKEVEGFQEAICRIERTSDELLSKSEKIRQVEKLVAEQPEREPIDIGEQIKEAFTTVKKRYPDCDFSFSAPKDLYVNGSEKLALAAKEIVENAAEHNDASLPQVEVTVDKGDNGQYVCIRISDNGSGIPPSEYEVLTGERERSQINHTSGLGLWTANWIVTRAGGAIDFSADSTGTIVTIRLPRMPAPEN